MRGNDENSTEVHWQDRDADLEWDTETLRWVGRATVVTAAAAGLAIAAAAYTGAKAIVNRATRR